MRRRARFGAVDTVGHRTGHTRSHSPSTQSTPQARSHANPALVPNKAARPALGVPDTPTNDVCAGRLTRGVSIGDSGPRGQFSCKSKAVLTVQSINYSSSSSSGNTLVGKQKTRP